MKKVVRLGDVFESELHLISENVKHEDSRIEELDTEISESEKRRLARKIFREG